MTATATDTARRPDHRRSRRGYGGSAPSPRDSLPRRARTIEVTVTGRDGTAARRRVEGRPGTGRASRPGRRTPGRQPLREPVSTRGPFRRGLLAVDGLNRLDTAHSGDASTGARRAAEVLDGAAHVPRIVEVRETGTRRPLRPIYPARTSPSWPGGGALPGRRRRPAGEPDHRWTGRSPCGVPNRGYRAVTGSGVQILLSDSRLSREWPRWRAGPRQDECSMDPAPTAGSTAVRYSSSSPVSSSPSATASMT